MKYSRNFFDKFEWLHNPISPIEESLMLPLQLDNSIGTISKRTGISVPKNAWKIINGYLYFRNQYWRLFLQIGFLAFIYNYFKEIKIARDRWLKQVIPNYLREIEKISQVNLSKLSQKQKLYLLKKAANLEGNLFGESIYVVLYCVSTELALKFLYPIFVKGAKQGDYYELLVGFSDKGLEMDTELWKISQMSEGKNKEETKTKWIEKFGYRIQDKDLIYPTLGENNELINHYLKLYKDISDPRFRQKGSEKKRIAREKFIEENMRKIPLLSKFFTKVLYYAQKYAKTRNSRPFYYMGNKYMRQILFSFSDQAGILENRNDIFFLRIEELKGQQLEAPGL